MSRVEETHRGHKWTREEIESLEVGDIIAMELDGRFVFEGPISSFTFSGVSIKGHFYLGFYQQFDKMQISGSISEGESHYRLVKRAKQKASIPPRSATDYME